MSINSIIIFYTWLITINDCVGTSSLIQPFTTYKHSIELQKDVADLWWSVDNAEKEILCELHIKSTGWIALGISPGKLIFKMLTSPV